jgi:hypothetical protein
MAKRGRPRKKEAAVYSTPELLEKAVYYDAKRELIVCELPELNYSFVSAVDAFQCGFDISKLKVFHG